MARWSSPDPARFARALALLTPKARAALAHRFKLEGAPLPEDWTVVHPYHEDVTGLGMWMCVTCGAFLANGLQANIHVSQAYPGEERHRLAWWCTSHQRPEQGPAVLP